MKLPSHEISAFVEIARTQNITLAAQKLFVTQSALSQRIQKLESLLECTLFIRDRKGLQLTEAGTKLLRYCQSVEGLEEEFLNEIQNSQELVGSLRIGAFSSVLRSVIIPTLTPFLRKHPRIHCEFRRYEVLDLPKALENSEAEMVVCDFHMNKAHIEEKLLGEEHYVLIESSKHSCPDNVFLDHGPLDTATEDFFKAQNKSPSKSHKVPTNYRRSYMGDAYAIMDAVAEGLGRAVMSKHLVEGQKGLRIVKGFKPYSRPVVLHYFKRDYTPKLQQLVIQQLAPHKWGNDRLLP
ncbi:MAG: LysR family transcriptional regulator [Bdellovibrionota bacterium]